MGAEADHTITAAPLGASAASGVRMFDIGPLSGSWTSNADPTVALAARTRWFCTQLTSTLPPAIATSHESESDPESEIARTGPNEPPAGRVVPRSARTPATFVVQTTATLPSASPTIRTLVSAVVVSVCGGPNPPPGGLVRTST